MGGGVGGGTEKRGGDKKILKRGDKLGQGVGAWKGGFEPPYELWYNFDALRYLVPVEQFKKREKDPWKSVSVSKVAGF